jgi:hypothetical protein
MLAHHSPALRCRENVINDGTTTASMASGTLADFALALRNKRIDDDIMVATADSLFYPDTVNVWGIMQVGSISQPQLPSTA